MYPFTPPGPPPQLWPHRLSLVPDDAMKKLLADAAVGAHVTPHVVSSKKGGGGTAKKAAEVRRHDARGTQGGSGSYPLK
jgi:hypothetical protein